MPERIPKPATEKVDPTSGSGEELLDGFERVIQLRARRGTRREVNTAIPTEISQLSEASRVVVHQDPRSAAADRIETQADADHREVAAPRAAATRIMMPQTGARPPARG